MLSICIFLASAITSKIPPNMPITPRKSLVMNHESPKTEINTTGNANPRQSIRRFYLAFSFSLIAVVFIGFARTYYLSAFFSERTRVLTWLLHLHGAVFSAWFVLLLVQIILVARGRTDLHRRVGVAGRSFRLASWFCLASWLRSTRQSTGLSGLLRAPRPWPVWQRRSWTWLSLARWPPLAF